MMPVRGLSLNDVSVLITTFLRPLHLRECLAKLRMNFTDCEVVIACDDDITSSNLRDEETWIRLPYDSGLTAKRNAAVRCALTRYSLLGCDDFNFSLTAREGVLRMAEVLDANPDIDVVVGKYNDQDYAGAIEYVPGDYIATKRLPYHALPDRLKPYPMFKVDIGVNYFLARTRVLLEVPWDEDIHPIGGEHCDWFLSLKEAGKKVYYLPCAKIDPFDVEGWDIADRKRYIAARSRAQIGHRQFLVKRGIRKFYGFGELPE